MPRKRKTTRFQFDERYETAAQYKIDYDAKRKSRFLSIRATMLASNFTEMEASLRVNQQRVERCIAKLDPRFKTAGTLKYTCDWMFPESKPLAIKRAMLCTGFKQEEAKQVAMQQRVRRFGTKLRKKYERAAEIKFQNEKVTLTQAMLAVGFTLEEISHKFRLDRVQDLIVLNFLSSVDIECQRHVDDVSVITTSSDLDTVSSDEDQEDDDESIKSGYTEITSEPSLRTGIRNAKILPRTRKSVRALDDPRFEMAAEIITQFDYELDGKSIYTAMCEAGFREMEIYEEGNLEKLEKLCEVIRKKYKRAAWIFWRNRLTIKEAMLAAGFTKEETMEKGTAARAMRIVFVVKKEEELDDIDKLKGKERMNAVDFDYIKYSLDPDPDRIVKSDYDKSFPIWESDLASYEFHQDVIWNTKAFFSLRIALRNAKSLYGDDFSSYMDLPETPSCEKPETKRRRFEDEYENV